jgi:hypothetical protein
MTEPVAPDDGDDLEFDAPMTVTDWIEVISDDLESAADALSDQGVEQLCRAIRRKLAEISGDGEPVSPSEKPQYWWQRD